ncbi:MAG: hypothetical protein ACKVOG_09150 [Rhodoglobus sp.]
MTPIIPLVLRATDLPLAELLAARLDGEVFAVGAGFAPVDELEQPPHRAASLSSANPRLIAEQRTAAWIWGALASPPVPHEFCSTLDERVAHQTSRWITVREVVIEPDDMVTLAGRQVTSALRTCVDLARFSAIFADEERQIVRYLMASTGIGMPEFRGHLNRRRNLPHKTLAEERLASCI